MSVFPRMRRRGFEKCRSFLDGTTLRVLRTWCAVPPFRLPSGFLQPLDRRGFRAACFLFPEGKESGSGRKMGWTGDGGFPYTYPCDERDPRRAEYETRVPEWRDFAERRFWVELFVPEGDWREEELDSKLTIGMDLDTKHIIGR